MSKNLTNLVSHIIIERWSASSSFRYKYSAKRNDEAYANKIMDYLLDNICEIVANLNNCNIYAHSYNPYIPMKLS